MHLSEMVFLPNGYLFIINHNGNHLSPKAQTGINTVELAAALKIDGAMRVNRLLIFLR